MPIKPELLAEMKARFQSLAAKPIKKVAEARARKRTRAEARLKAAKKRAEAVANDPDMSAGRKLKEVERAMARASAKRPDKGVWWRPGSKSGVRKATSAPKGATKGSRVVSVDARMKKDKRAAKSRAKKQKSARPASAAFIDLYTPSTRGANAREKAEGKHWPSLCADIIREREVVGPLE